MTYEVTFAARRNPDMVYTVSAESVAQAERVARHCVTIEAPGVSYLRKCTRKIGGAA